MNNAETKREGRRFFDSIQGRKEPLERCLERGEIPNSFRSRKEKVEEALACIAFVITFFVIYVGFTFLTVGK